MSTGEKCGNCARPSVGRCDACPGTVSAVAMVEDADAGEVRSERDRLRAEVERLTAKLAAYDGAAPDLDDMRNKLDALDAYALAYRSTHERRCSGDDLREERDTHSDLLRACGVEVPR